MNSSLFDAGSLSTLLEATMLLCFGVAWPVAKVRLLRNGRASDNGCGFTVLILCGYVVGALAKLLATMRGEVLAPVIWLYVLNAGSVGRNLFLQWYLRARARSVQTGAPPSPQLCRDTR